MVDVSRWLAEQGLGHHAEAFAKNGIAGAIVREITDADLKELGLNLGDRKRLLKAVAALAAGSTDARAETAEPTATPTAPRKAERHQLTVMFVDLVGSTALSATLDPEDLREVIRAHHRCVAAVVERFEGHVTKYLGDGVFAYLGWPKRTRTMPSGRCVPGWRLLVPSLRSHRFQTCSCRPAWASPRVSRWSAT